MTLNLVLAILPTPFFLGSNSFCESGKIIPVPNSFSNLSSLPFFFLFIFCFDKRIRDREREGALQPSSQAKPAPSASQGPAGPCLLTLAAPFSRSHLPPAAPPSPSSAPHLSSLDPPLSLVSSLAPSPYTASSQGEELPAPDPLVSLSSIPSPSAQPSTFPSLPRSALAGEDNQDGAPSASSAPHLSISPSPATRAMRSWLRHGRLPPLPSRPSVPVPRDRAKSAPSPRAGPAAKPCRWSSPSS